MLLFGPSFYACVPHTPHKVALCPTCQFSSLSNSMGLASKLRAELAEASALPPAAPMSTADVPVLTARIQQVLDKAVKDRGLGVFYDATKIQALAVELANKVDYDDLVRRTNKAITKDMAIELSALALYDTVFLCDDSSSMNPQFNAGRADDLAAILSQTAQVVTLFDTDGVSVRFLNSNKGKDNLRTHDDVVKMLNDVPLSGGTPLGTMFQEKIVNKFISHNMKKPVLVFIITDGEPQPEHHDTLLNAIKKVQREYGACRLAVQIAQVGTDARAQAFLKTLDDDATVGNMIDVTSHYELEAEEWKAKNHGTELTVFLYLMKMWLGAINSEYDSLD